VSRLVKICGIKTVEAFDATVEAGADFIGFNFFPPSPRYITPAQAALLSARPHGGLKFVGLFVEPTLAQVQKTLGLVKLDAVQIYAAAAAIARLRAALPVPVWRAVGVAQTCDLPAADEADAFVLEAKPPPGATRPGGNAAIADWGILSQFKTPHPWFVAGGLTPENVAKALTQTGASGADVASGVENEKGQKDNGRIIKFCKSVRQIG
jgi:phosphoribosylanthranilate isomerase